MAINDQTMNPARDRMSNMAHNAVDRAANMRHQTSEWLDEHGQQLSAKQRRLVDNTTRYVSANPLKSIGIAVLAALVVGRMMK